MVRLFAAALAMASASVDIPTKEIAPGVNMPVISIGNGGLESRRGYGITSDWLKLGGRGIDTANNYQNQVDLAKAIADSGVERKDIFITTKIPGCSNVESYVQQNLQQLNTDYIDLLLIHFPKYGDCPSAWKTLEGLHATGTLKAIGISQFKRSDIEPLMKVATVTPHVNQMQLNILEHDDDQIAASQENGILVEAFSPVGRSGHSGDITGNSVIKAVSAAHNVSTYQVALKWVLQKGHLLTFQSSNAAHQESDAEVFGFELSDSEIAQLDRLQVLV